MHLCSGAGDLGTLPQVFGKVLVCKDFDKEHLLWAPRFQELRYAHATKVLESLPQVFGKVLVCKDLERAHPFRAYNYGFWEMLCVL